MKKRSLQARLNRLLICFVAIPLLIMTILITVSRWKSKVAQEDNELVAILDNIEAYTYTFQYQTESIVRSFADSAGLTKLAKSVSDAEWAIVFRNETQPEMSKAESYLSSLDAKLILISEVCPSERWYFLLNAERFADDVGYKEFLSSSHLSSWQGIHPALPKSLSNVFEYREYGSKLIYYCKPNGGPSNTNLVIRCAVSIDPIIKTAIAQAGERSITFLSNNTVYYSNTPNNVDLPSFESKSSGKCIENNRIWQKRDIENLGLSILISRSVSDIYTEFQRTSGGFLMLVLLAVLLVFVTSKVVLRTFLRRLQRIADAADSIRTTSGRVHLPEDGEDEVGHVIQAFNGLYDRIDAQMAESLQKEKDKNHMRALALQYQLNPHFLFNSLLWLQMELEQRNVDMKITDNITKLGDILRYNLSESSFATLAEEITHLQAYITFMCDMKQQEINLCIEHTSDNNGILIPRFMLQPVVENALQHGLVSGRPMDITVSIHENPPNLIFQIANNGKAISSEQLKKLYEIFRTPENKCGSGLGLSNLVQRLNLYYPDRYQIAVHSSDICTRFEIQIPKHIAKGDAQ